MLSFDDAFPSIIVHKPALYLDQDFFSFPMIDVGLVVGFLGYVLYRASENIVARVACTSVLLLGLSPNVFVLGVSPAEEPPQKQVQRRVSLIHPQHQSLHSSDLVQYAWAGLWRTWLKPGVIKFFTKNCMYLSFNALLLLLALSLAYMFLFDSTARKWLGNIVLESYIKVPYY